MSKVKKLGRPNTIPWNEVNLLWKHKSNSELAIKLGCSYTNVYLKRNALIAKAVANNKNPDGYIYTHGKWNRTKKPVGKV